ncbi:MAG: hypothetical protein AAFQ88_01180, partial [Pseudomonadota bacterium]
MQNRQIEALCQMMAGEDPFLHYPDREAAALLCQVVQAPTAVPALRQGRFGKMAGRAPVRELIGRAGGGVVEPDALAVLARPDAIWPRSRLGEAAQTIAAARPWQWFRRSFAVWHGDRQSWRWRQMSRPGANLVLQIGFPVDHDAAFYRLFGRCRRGDFESPHHPIRTEGAITMAWARLSLHFKGGRLDADWEEDLLVEEIQSDWFGEVDAAAEWMATQAGTDDRRRVGLERHEHYRRHYLAPYRRDWAAATLMAVIELARRELGIKRLWLPQPATGAVLKGITGAQPPVSLYTTLPRRFCFEPTQDAPRFLEEARIKALRALRRSK